jgi:hypothetical protein
MNPHGVTGRRTTWALATSTELVGATCLWQDLDGLHVAAPPPEPPPTSILWAWTDHTLFRLRLDDTTVHLARCPASTPATATIPWNATADSRVAAYRPAPGTGRDGLGTTYLEVTIDTGPAGPVTFIRPATATGGPQ